ncbi:MAG: glycosyl hydrolase 115 family protein [Kiritimatiellae bacterium]|nr:glycosyl hydrolase 115 family protein [Kiritimatiellia bacterium]
MKRGCVRWAAAVVALGAMNLQAISIQEEIDVAAAKGGGLVVVPSGEHFSDGPIRLKSNVELHLEEGATIVFSDDPAKYLPAVPTSWEGVECLNYSPLVYAYGCTNVAITGNGTFAPRMKFWRKWFARDAGHRAATRKLYDWCSFNAPLGERDLTKLPESNVRPHLIQFNRCKDVRLDGFRIRESPFWTIHLFLCDGVVARGLDVYAHGHNNDGIDIEMTRNVLVENCRFDQGDDAIVIKSGRNQDAWRLATPSENIEIRNCTVVNGHVLLGIGSEMSGGVRNVYMHDCTLESEAFRLFYVKTNERRGGFVENIRMEGVKAKNVSFGVMSVETDVMYQWKDFPTHEVRVTPIRNLSMKDVTVEEAERLVDLRGDARDPIDGVTLENVRVGKVRKADRIENAVNVNVNQAGVRYRGIFINDEDWSLRPWAERHFGKDEQIGTNAYAEIFALMKRNGLNLIWPAMHEGGYEFSSRPENLALAAKEGIVVGTSHCEPMLRNNCYLSKADKKRWSWTKNRAFLEEYWREGVRRGSTFAKATVDKTGNGERGTGVLWTIGMRGIHDGRMPDGKTTADKRKILEEVFAAQCAMLPEGAPKIFCPYKEVLPIFNSGLNVPEDATIMWTNDNFGYVRRVGDNHGIHGKHGKQGIYWHLSYHGSPHGYIHLCTTPPAFMWYELVAKCWANGVRDVWMVNAGDVFQAEVLLDAYGKFAANPEGWGVDAQDRFLGEWAENFLATTTSAKATAVKKGAKESGDRKLCDLCGRLKKHLAEYYNLGFNRKPEHICVQWTTNLPAAVKSSLLKRYHALLAEDIAIESALPEVMRDEHFRLVGFQVRFLAYAGIIHLEGKDKAYARSVIDPLYERWDKMEGGKWSGFWCDTIDEHGGRRRPTKHNRWSSQMQWPWNEPTDPTAKDRGVARIDYPATAYRADVEEPTWMEPVKREEGRGKREEERGEWVNVEGLGTSGRALALLPVKPGAGEGAALEYSLTGTDGTYGGPEPLPKVARQVALVLQFLPDFALWPGLKLGVNVVFDGCEPKFVEVPCSNSNLGEHDRARNKAVQDNFIRVEIPVPAGATSFRIVAKDPGVVIDRIGIRK